jgi:hypothetical protein
VYKIWLIAAALTVLPVGCKTSRKLHLVENSPYVNPKTGGLVKAKPLPKWQPPWERPSLIRKDLTPEQARAQLPAWVTLAVLGRVAASRNQRKHPKIEVDNLEMDYWKNER